MRYKVRSIVLEENDKDLVISFVLLDPKLGASTLTLIRTQFYEELLNDEMKGVHISMTRDSLQEEVFNTLTSINISDDNIDISSSLDEYHLDVSDISAIDMKNMLLLLNKQNSDNQFVLNVVETA